MGVRTSSKCPIMILVYMIFALLATPEVCASKKGLMHILNHLDPTSPKIIEKVYVNQKVNNEYNMTFMPSTIEDMIEGEERQVNFEMLCCVSPGLQLTIIPGDSDVAQISKNQTIEVVPSVDNVFNTTFTVLGRRLGLTNIKFYLHPIGVDCREDDLIYSDYEVIVLREEQLRDDIYRIGIIVCASLIYLGFGCQIDLKWIWKICKKPVAPAIAVFCQFVIMPLLGFSVAKLLKLDDEYAFGLLAMSCSPGGGGSNVYANLLRGDLDLSITCTFFSTLLSLVTMPFWMFTLGRFFIDEERISIPYGTIVRSLLTIVLPLVIGVVIRKFLPKVAKFMVKATKPFSLFFILYMLTYGTWVNWYMFVIMGTVPEIIPAATLVPTLGFGLGYLITYLFKQGNTKSTTVSVETGYQNASIPIIMLQGNFQQPEGDLGAVMPVATAFFMQIPLYIWYTVLEIRDRCCKNEVTDENMVSDLEDGEKGVEITTVAEDGENKVKEPDMIEAYKKRTDSRQSNKDSIAMISYTDNKQDAHHIGAAKQNGLVSVKGV